MLMHSSQRAYSGSAWRVSQLDRRRHQDPGQLRAEPSFLGCLSPAPLPKNRSQHLFRRLHHHLAGAVPGQYNKQWTSERTEFTKHIQRHR